MNSALKPVLTTPTSQTSSATPAALNNKPMHPQPPATYGQPSTHVSPNNSNFAHGHPNPAHQSNHFSLNVPSAPQHYGSNTSTIPASNHPVASVTQPPPSTGQTYSPNKNVSYPGGYQPNLGHPPHPNPIPPVSQSLVATQPVQPAPVPTEAPSEKPHSNGTPQTKSPVKSDNLDNHVTPQKDKQVLTNPEKPTESSEDKSNNSPVLSTQNQSKVETPTKIEETKATSSVNEPAAAAMNLSPTADTSTASETVDNVRPTTTKKSPVKTSESETNDAQESTNDSAQNVTPSKKEKESKPSSTPKASTPRTPTRKSKTPKPENESPKSSKADNKTPVQKLPSVSTKTKRNRVKTQPYQSPLPEIEIITKISSSLPKNKNSDEKLIVFFKNEFLAVRNSEGSFYICQAVQNIYKSSPKIRIRWLSQDKNDKSGEVYTPDFYDYTDFDCILTNLNLVRINKGLYRLPPAEKERTDSILKRSLAVEKGEVTSPSLTEEHPDGIDVSLYKEESQLKKKRAAKRKASSPIRAGRKSNKSKSPDQPKVAKPTPKSAKATKRTAVQASSSNEAKKGAAAASRTDRAKRRNDIQNHANKDAPVVDQKKARVLAKVVRKTGGSTNKSNAKNTKATKTSTLKVQKTPPKAATKKTKRAAKK